MDDLVSFFTELASTLSPPGDERAVADRVGSYMADLGLDVSEDDAGSKIGSNAGNLYARVAATDGGTPIFLCAHLDTVPPEAGIEPVVEDGVIRNSAGTILGADNKSAVVVMLEATRRILAENRPHGGIELLFTPMEEVGLHGAAAFDHERLDEAPRRRWDVGCVETPGVVAPEQRPPLDDRHRRSGSEPAKRFRDQRIL